MDRPALEATRRQELGTRAARRLRAQGLLPAVLYGHQRGTVHLAVSAHEAERLVDGGARMVDMAIGGTTETALLKEIQYDAMGDDLLHIDFARVAMDEKVEVAVPIELHGLPKGVEEGGTLDHLLVDLEVRCLPADIPEHIRVEVGHLAIGDIIHLSDLTLPPEVEVLQDPEMPVATVHPPEEIEEEAPEEIELEAAAEPEVIGRGEEEEEPPGGEEDQEG
ncbi:MAG: 50S ribosomal protein L25 [Candidatus Brocadiia bacterium]